MFIIQTIAIKYCYLFIQIDLRKKPNIFLTVKNVFPQQNKNTSRVNSN